MLVLTKQAQRLISCLLIISLFYLTSYLPLHESQHFSADYSINFEHTDSSVEDIHGESGDCSFCLQAAGLHNLMPQLGENLLSAIYEKTYTCVFLQNVSIQSSVRSTYQPRAPPILS